MAKLLLWLWIIIQPLVISMMTGFVTVLILRFAYPKNGGSPEGFAPPDNIYEILIILSGGVLFGLIAGVFLSIRIHHQYLSSKTAEE